MKIRHVVSCLLLGCLLLLHPNATYAQNENAKQLTIATYNLENLFDVWDDPYTKDETTRVKPREELETIAKLLKTLNADVIAVQEVENEGVLKAFVREFLGDMGYDYIVTSQSNDMRGIDVGVISRVPIASVTSYKYRKLSLPGEANTWHFARDLLRVRLQATKDKTLDVFVVHLKSKRTTNKNDPKSTKWRTAEATMAKSIIDDALKKDPKAWLTITGDFNDTPETKPIDAFLKGGTAGALTDLHTHIPAEKRITYLNEPYRSTIDYVLASPELAKRSMKEKATVFAGESLLKGSDHAPVVATFNLGD